MTREKTRQGQRKVREFSFWVQKKWHFQEKSREIEIIQHSWFNTIEGWNNYLGSLWSHQFSFSLMKTENVLKTYQSSSMGGKDGCKGRIEAVTLSDILYSGKWYFYPRKGREFWKVMSVATIFFKLSERVAHCVLFCFACQVFGFDGSTTIQEFSETINRVSWSQVCL